MALSLVEAVVTIDRWTRKLFRAETTPAERDVALALSATMQPDLTCHPGVQVLAEMTGRAVRTVCRALAGLRRKGLILLVSRANRYRGLADVYRLAGFSRAESHATRSTPLNTRTTGRGARSALAQQADATLTSERPELSSKERDRLTSRAERTHRSGVSVDLVLRALTAPLPDDTRSPAAVLHQRLIELEDRGEHRGAAFIAGLARRVGRFVPGRHTPTTPRSREAFGTESSVEMSRW